MTTKRALTSLSNVPAKPIDTTTLPTLEKPHTAPQKARETVRIESVPAPLTNNCKTGHHEDCVGDIRKLYFLPLPSHKPCFCDCHDYNHEYNHK